MRIGIDVRMIESSGIGTSVRQVLDHRSPTLDSNVVLFASPNFKNNYQLRTHVVPYPIYSLAQHWKYPSVIKSEKLSVFYMPHFDVPLFFNGPFVATVHDLNHLVLPSESKSRFASVYAWLAVRHVAKRARRILVDSENTKKDLLRYFPEAEERIDVVFLGVDPFYKPATPSVQESTLKKFNLKAGYLLYVGNLRGSKNTLRLIEAYKRLRGSRPDCPELIMVGKNSLPGSPGRGKFPAGIRHLGVVETSDLPALYSSASVFVFPTLYEGFGLPPLEAMACGCPVVASKVASVPEVCGDAVEYIDPYSVDSISGGIEKLISSSSRREELREKGFQNVKRFPVQSYADKVWKILRDVAAEKL